MDYLFPLNIFEDFVHFYRPFSDNIWQNQYMIW